MRNDTSETNPNAQHLVNKDASSNILAHLIS